MTLFYEESNNRCKAIILARGLLSKVNIRTITIGQLTDVVSYFVYLGYSTEFSAKLAVQTMECLEWECFMD